MISKEIGIIFTVTVTNLATLCQASDQLTVSITGGPLSANPVAVPSLVCQGGSSQLFANAGGGSENYSFSWTCLPSGIPPWSSSEANPVILPDTSKIYKLVVNDGFATINESVVVIVFSLPTATISGGDTLCGPNASTSLQVDLTGIPPWYFTYTFGDTTVFINDVSTTPYYFIASDPCDYTISYVEDAYCSGDSYGTAIVRKYPIPAKPEITVYQTELISSSCCGNQWYNNGEIIPDLLILLSGSLNIVTAASLSVQILQKTGLLFSSMMILKKSQHFIFIHRQGS